MFRLVTVAYETLSDPRTRAEYDARRGIAADGEAPYDPGMPDQSVYAPSSDEAADPGWGEETTWKAAEGRPNPDVDNFDPHAWIHTRSGSVASWAVDVALTLLFSAGLVVLLYAPGALRPASAGNDLFGWYTEQPVVRLIVTLVYLLLLSSARDGPFYGLLFAHAFFIVCLIAWPVAYWDVATTAERSWYVVATVLWIVYSGLLVAHSVFADAKGDRRRYEDALEIKRVSAVTRWARGESGRLALRTAGVATAILFAAVAAVLIFGRGLLVPDAAGADALSTVMRYPVLGVVVVAAYGYLLYISIGDNPGEMSLAHVPLAIGLLIWPLAYWDLATMGERWTFLAIVATWLCYRGALHATSSLIDRRRADPEWTR